MKQLIFALVVLAVVSGPSEAVAQTSSAGEGAAAAPLLASAVRLAAQQPPVSSRDDRDSLVNGIVIGAVIGGATLGVSGAVICNLLKETGDPSCWGGVLAIGAIGAGIGAGAGAGIDALLARNGLPAPERRGRERGRSLVATWTTRF
jgi:hypothetical protein